MYTRIFNKNNDKSLIKVVKTNGDVESIPLKYISLQSYISTPHQRQDLDSYQDNNGVLHRNVVSHYRSKCEFNTPPLLEKDLLVLQNLLNSCIINAKERKGRIMFYCFDTHQYETMTCYIPDVTFTPLRITDSGEVIMDKVRFAFIEY